MNLTTVSETRSVAVRCLERQRYRDERTINTIAIADIAVKRQHCYAQDITTTGQMYTTMF